ncbi:MAG: hypothetical protein LC733_09850 [Actinobacteria bacterium]|nr:hypothetical protein [Actinomycetota bacterium]
MASAALRLNSNLYFAGHAKSWGGAGVAFLDLDAAAEGKGAFARAWLISQAQLDDVIAQENGRGHPSSRVDVDRVVAESRVALGPGRYQTVLHVGDHAGHPMVTFSAPWSLADVVAGRTGLALNGPSPRYQEIIAGGLAETHGLNRAQAEAYFRVTIGHEAFEEIPADFWSPPADSTGMAALAARVAWRRSQATSEGTGRVRAHERRSADGQLSEVRAHHRRR